MIHKKQHLFLSPFVKCSLENFVIARIDREIQLNVCGCLRFSRGKV